MTKSVSISVRVPDKDADYIAKLQIEGAVTSSDKIRAIIRQARKADEHHQSFDGYLFETRERLRAVGQMVKEKEKEQHTHSEFLAFFTDWLGEAYAFLSAAPHEIKAGELKLTELEAGLSDRSFRLMDQIARMGVTSKAPCYDKELISNGFAPLYELTELINKRLSKEGKI